MARGCRRCRAWARRAEAGEGRPRVVYPGPHDEFASTRPLPARQAALQVNEGGWHAFMKALRSRRMVLLGVAAPVGLGWALGGAQGCQREDAPAALRIYAAASLHDAFGALGVAFRRLHPDVPLAFSFAGSQQLRTQIEHGAAFDVFAAADRADMEPLLRAKLVGAPVVFAHNELVLIVNQTANAISHWEELPNLTRLVIGADEVPIGRYTLRVLQRSRAVYGSDFATRVLARVVSRELNVRQVLAKVRLGEANGGIVYRSDAEASRADLRLIEIPAEVNVVADYPIGVASGSRQGPLAAAFVRLVLSREGKHVLRRHGFSGSPP